MLPYHLLTADFYLQICRFIVKLSTNHKLCGKEAVIPTGTDGFFTAKIIIESTVNSIAVLIVLDDLSRGKFI